MPVTGKPTKYSKYILRAIFHIKQSMTLIQKKYCFAGENCCNYKRLKVATLFNN